MSLGSLTAVAVLPIALALRAGGAFSACAAGGGVWLVSVALKGPAARWLNRAVARRPRWATACLQGALSAASELGLAWLALAALRIDSLADALIFGIGAGSAEIVYVLFQGVRSGKNADAVRAWEREARASLCVRYAVPLERLLASIGHVSSRGLVFLSARDPAAGWPAGLAAFLFFAGTDGAAYYGHLAGWNWIDAKVCRRFYGALGVLEAIQASLFVLSLRWLAPA